MKRERESERGRVCVGGCVRTHARAYDRFLSSLTNACTHLVGNMHSQFSTPKKQTNPQSLSSFSTLPWANNVHVLGK